MPVVIFEKKKKKLRKNIPSWYFLFKVNNGNATTTCEICSKLTIKTPELCLAIKTLNDVGVFIVNFKHILYIALVFPLLNLDK